jgi:hypothetical protein
VPSAQQLFPLLVHPVPLAATVKFCLHEQFDEQDEAVAVSVYVVFGASGYNDPPVVEIGPGFGLKLAVTVAGNPMVKTDGMLDAGAGGQSGWLGALVGHRLLGALVGARCGNGVVAPSSCVCTIVPLEAYASCGRALGYACV